MNRITKQLVAGFAATAALAAGSVALAPQSAAPEPASGGYLGELLESLVLMRDGHGARLPAEEPNHRRNP